MKNRKVIPSFLAAACAFQILAGAPVSILAAGTGYAELSAADTVAAKTDEKKFTHKEWTGTDYTDLSGTTRDAEDVFGINREDASTSIIPYQSEAAAAASVWNYDAREESTWMQMLTGKNQNWDLTVVQNETEANAFMGDNGFMTEGFTPSADAGWKSVTLPQSWTTQGFDFSIYTNVQMPW